MVIFFMIVVLILFLISLAINAYYISTRYERSGNLVIMTSPEGKLKFRFELNKELEDLRIGERFILRIVGGEYIQEIQE